MNNDELIEKCNALRLSGMSKGLIQQAESDDYTLMSFETRLSELLDRQLDEVSDRQITNLRKRAKLRWPQATIADIDYTYHPKLKRQVIEKLARCDWLKHYQHIIIQGATGTGKTYIACALAQEAILLKFTVAFFRFQDLILQLLAAYNTGELDKLRKRLSKIKLLVIDDWGIAALDDRARHLLFELVEQRDQNASLLITSQYPVSAWHEAFQDQTIADSVLDRIVHKSHKINLAGDSIRKLLGLQGEDNA